MDVVVNLFEGRILCTRGWKVSDRRVVVWCLGNQYSLVSDQRGLCDILMRKSSSINYITVVGVKEKEEPKVCTSEVWRLISQLFMGN